MVMVRHGGLKFFQARFLKLNLQECEVLPKKHETSVNIENELEPILKTDIVKEKEDHLDENLEKILSVKEYKKWKKYKTNLKKKKNL